jgi:serine phosphatase RsbU (regulator of sigma subunit)
MNAQGSEVQNAEVVTRARTVAVVRAHELGREDLADDAALVVSELVTNALLHGGGHSGVEVSATDDGLRIAVRDRSRVPPVMGHASNESLTGRGVRVVATLATRWGAEVEDDGKVVWAEVTGRVDTAGEIAEDDLLAMWDDAWELEPQDERFHIELGDVPTDLLLAAKSHVDSVVREFALASVGAESGMTPEVAPHLGSILHAVVERFAEARQSIKRQALQAARAEVRTTRLTLELPASAADAAEEYLAALDEVDAYCRARRLLTLESPPQHRVFRHWYIGELVTQLRAAAAGQPTPVAQPFEQRLLVELDRMELAQRASERAARLYSLATALATAATPEAVAHAVLNEGLAALAASGGGVLLATDADNLALSGAVGYDPAVVRRLRDESRDAELPAALALRTGESVWLESREERDRRFPQLAGMEATTVALCAVPLEVPGRRLGALRFSFTQARLFDEEERRFVLALAGQTAQALERAQLERARADVSRRLQRSLLPPSLPVIPGLEVAAIYHPYGDGIDVGGDFYDAWQIDEDRWAIAIGDASGNGPEAAALTAVVRHTLRAVTMTESDPRRVVAALNTALLNAAGDNEDDRFCTGIFGVVEAGDTVTVRLAGGGHPPVFVRRASGDIETVLVGGSLLGMFDDLEIGSVEFQLAGGDTMLLVTDGVIEARRDGQLFDLDGVERALAAPLKTAASTLEGLEAAVLEHTDGFLDDDVAAVVLHVVDADV